MLDDDTGTLWVAEEGVGTIGGGILREILGVGHLADVVVERTGTDQLGIRPDLGRCGSSQDRDLIGVLEGPRRHLGELLEQRCGHIA